MTASEYGIEEIEGRYNKVTGKRGPSHFNVYRFAGGEEIRHGLMSRDSAEGFIRHLENSPKAEPAPVAHSAVRPVADRQAQLVGGLFGRSTPATGSCHYCGGSLNRRGECAECI